MLIKTHFTMFTSRILPGVISLAFVVSCTHKEVNQKEEIFIKDLICDQSSKIWIIDEQVVEDSIISPEERNEKMAISFYSDGKFFMQNMMDLAFLGPMHGTYKIKDDKILLRLSTIKAPQTFEVIHANKDSVVFENRASNGSINMKMRLVPFDHPQEKPLELEQRPQGDISVN